MPVPWPLSPAVRKLLSGLEERRKKRSLELLGRGEVTFNKAAEIAGMDVWAFADLLRRKGVDWVSSTERMKSDIEAGEEQ